MYVSPASAFTPVRWEPRIYAGALARLSALRADIRTDLTGFPAPVVDDITTCASELFANAVLYTASGHEGGEVVRSLSLTEPDTLRLEVVDSGWTRSRPSIPASRTEDDWMSAEGQRGLLLVHSLTVDWGYHPVLPDTAVNLGLGVWGDFTVHACEVPDGLAPFIATC